MVLGFKERFPDNEATNFVPKIEDGIKEHTIRLDKNDRYKVGTILHLATGVRTSNYNQFGWGVVTKIERIIIYPESCAITICNGTNSHNLSDAEIAQLTKRDGFKTVLRFWEWFNKKDYGEKFDGKLIHFKYIGNAECSLPLIKIAALSFLGA